ncbi:MAG: ATP phosphoribosyltransferase regulatory subunit [Sulfuricaulis sp.]|uniref:ATP phosphoribosyltransferase regulatory subunit n=1 Tax=Sulfuricaulis sp. TaxID=2003553 RepID=UPI0025E11BFD|nr:ATP phosphoribosyltransferase regulatory subunit [Sulfuricaulis sp.]MCR4345864.1 ATP phosphoribosyltransferase regulatory subunit [Sulfuricaulis sp.]
MSTKDRWLLPDGVEEILPVEARRVESLRRRLLDLFETWGYEFVMPPLIEYLESLLIGASRDLDLQTFKVTDHLTGRLMGVRPDMTPQAARIDAHYLKRGAPTRLCYMGSVLRTKPDGFGGSREPLQLGAELYGHAGPDADAEILGLMIESLRLAGIRDAHFDLGHVGVFRGLAAQAKLNVEQETELFEALQRKASNDVEALLAASDAPTASKRMLAGLLELSGGEEVLARARKQCRDAPKPVIRALDELQAVADRVAKRPGAPTLNFDLAELSGYHYYTGVVFSAFVPGYGQAIARGGRYDGIGQAFGRDRAATGFGADLRQWLRVSAATTPVLTGVLVSNSDDSALQAETSRLRAEGQRVVMRLSGDKSPASEFGCDRELVKKNGRWVIQSAK